MVEILAAIGLGAKELFNYNRESFKFDQDQRLEREQLRLEMQVKRFELFREDVRDLVELTVGRMDVYHLVGALFLEFCVSFFCEGRVQASAPPFLLSLFLLSNACAFVYLLLAVWLSMHASIASHSLGVRLLTRFVRLPIPTSQQITSMTSRLADFEAQGLDKVLRLPVLAPSQNWRNPGSSEDASDAAASSAAAAGSSAEEPPAASKPATTRPGPGPPAPCATGPGGGAAAPPSGGGSTQAGEPASEPRAAEDERRNLLGRGEVPFSGEDMLLRPAAALPGLHVQLFRRLQAKWQCYDAYCRVCMALGVNQILQGLTYYSIVHTLVENRSPSAGFALILIFQAAAVAVAILDVSGLRRRAIVLLQAIGTAPAVLAACAVCRARRTETGALEPHEDYPSTPAMFLLQVVWLECLLRVAAPSADDASLPRRFRTVLFLDVFGDASDPTEAEHGPPELRASGGWGSQEEQCLAAERVASAETALAIAEAAFRRWHGVPHAVLSDLQRRDLSRLRVELNIWRRALGGEIAWRNATVGLLHELTPSWVEQELRPWGELLPAERAEDPFLGFVLGPFEHDTGYHTTMYYFDLERVHYLWDGPGGAPVLTLEAVAASIRGLEAAVRLLLAMSEQRSRSDSADGFGTGGLSEPTSPVGGAYPVAAAVAGVAYVAHGLRGLRRRLTGSGMREVEMVEPLDRPLLRRQPSNDSGPRHGPGDRGQSALAGPHARHFVPERLPWQVLRGLTRVLQLAWAYTGSMAVLRELGLYRIDFQQHPGKERRLAAIPGLGASEGAASLAELLQVAWPHGELFFEPHSLSCVSQDDAEQVPLSRLVLGTPFALYRTRHRGALSPLYLEELAEESFPSSASVVCGYRQPHNEAPACLLAALCPEGVALWRWGSSQRAARVLAVADGGLTWRLLAGAVLPCEDGVVIPVHLDGARGVEGGWCLVLAGWDGQRLPVAVLPLPGGPGTLPEAGARIRPRLRAPLQTGSAEVAALHLAAHRPQLWAVLTSGELRSWDLSGTMSPTSWAPRWPPLAGGGAFRAKALCEAATSELLVLGQGDAGPGLLRMSPSAILGGSRLVQDRVGVSASSG